MEEKTKRGILAVLFVALLIAGICYWNWYHTRISPNTPQTSRIDCPENKPIKGNAQSGIYHTPGSQYYAQTKPERCFVTIADAVDAGYRESK